MNDVRAPQRVNCNDFVDSLMFLLRLTFVVQSEIE